MGKDVLCGWKEIEDFIGLKKDALLTKGFPVRKIGKTVMALKSEILAFISSKPRLNSKTANKR